MSRNTILKNALKPSLENGDAVAELTGSTEQPPADTAVYPEDQLGDITVVSRDAESLEAVAHSLENLVQAIEACGASGLDEQGKRFGALALHSAQSFVGMATDSAASLEAEGDLGSKAVEFLKKVWEAIKAVAAKLWQAVENFVGSAKQAMSGLAGAADKLVEAARKGVVTTPKVNISTNAAIYLESQGHIGNLVEIASHVEQSYSALMNLPDELRPRNVSIVALFKKLTEPKMSDDEWDKHFSDSHQSFQAAHPSVFNKKVDGFMACQPIAGGVAYIYHCGPTASDKGVSGALTSHMLGEFSHTSIVNAKYGLDYKNDSKFSSDSAKETVEVQTLSASDIERLGEIIKRIAKMGEEKIEKIFQLKHDFSAAVQGIDLPSLLQHGLDGRRGDRIAQLYYTSVSSMERKDSQMFFTLSNRFIRTAKACLEAAEAMVAA